MAILVTNGFEQVELTEPKAALEEAGATCDIVALAAGKVRAWDSTDWGQEFKVDGTVKKAESAEYDALLLPGGVMNPDKLRRDPDVLRFVQGFFEDQKPVGAICHGPWTLIDAGVVQGRKLTSYESIQTDLKNAGANWVDEEVVVDNGLVTSRRPDDLPAFCAMLVEEVSDGQHAAPRSVFEGVGGKGVD